MKRIFISIMAITLFANCNNSNNNTVDKSDRFELVPEADKDIREEYEKQKDLKQINCSFSNPDTSVIGIKIRNVESTIKILGEKTKLQGDSSHIFISRDNNQKLSLTVHPGDLHNQISIFKISYFKNSNHNYKKINSKEFETEKGIKLGINKKEIIEKLGNCYVAKDSVQTSITLNYRLESPADSKTKLLKSNNMPIYYATYMLKNDKLERIEFGFEYP
ncbi:hypothetical protein [Flavobacterium crassostreae]|uniref:hypothetical protein n=1 Tax=Flavobacterium crassostreae TaxID=1763534 RepID=UPI0012FD0F9D|nr:hypothetical protein [Flavobacterium crassostreae]